MRGDVSIFAATEYMILLFPLPLPPEVIVIQGASLVAIQASSLEAVTPTLPVPPIVAKDLVLVERVGGLYLPPDWRTVKV